MKKILQLIFISIISLLLLGGCDDITNPLDEIQYYEIKVDPRNDGSLDMHFNIRWRVLNDTSEGPLEWVKIGIPNYHVDEIKGLSDNIRSIKYSSDGGAYIRIDFKDKYYKNEELTFEFSTHQAYMYTLDEEYCYFNYNPGWFNEIKVLDAKVIWNKTNVIESNNNQSSGNYLIWEYALDYGETIDVNVKYDRASLPLLNTDRQYTNSSLTPNEVLGIFAFFTIAIVIIVVSIILYYRNRDHYMYHRGFYSHYIFFGGRHHYYHNGVNREGKKIVNPSPSGGRFGGHGGGFSCACACACAGGGRAGCSRKDFYNTNLQSQQIIRVIDKEKEIK